MSTHGLILEDKTWKNLISELSLEDNTGHYLQNVSKNYLCLSESITEPDENTHYHIIEPMKSEYIVPEPGKGIWIKAENPPIKIAITEAGF